MPALQAAPPPGGQPHRASLRAQLLRWLIPPLVVLVAGGAAASWFASLHFSRAAFDHGLHDSAAALARQVHFEARGPVVDLPGAADDILRADPWDRAWYRVTTDGGETIAGERGVPLPVQRPTAERPVLFEDATLDGQPVRIAALRVAGPRPVGDAIVVVAETTRKRTALAGEVFATAVLPQVALILATVAVVWIGVVRGLAPLATPAAALSRRGWGDLSPIGDAGIPAEALPLVSAINNLMERLASASREQQRFVADAAHQLRTPLAGLQAQADRALADDDPATLRHAIRQIAEASRRATRLVNQLLTLARAEPGNDPAAGFKVLDLSAVVRQACIDWVPEALSRDVDLGYQGPETPVRLPGDELLLTEMVNNLLHNALRYGAHPGTVTVSVQPEGRGCLLRVQDDGPGVPDTEIPKLFDRFHRVAGSVPGGCGLGLSIVRQIATAHGAKVRAVLAEAGRGLVVEVHFRQVMPESSRAPAATPALA